MSAASDQPTPKSAPPKPASTIGRRLIVLLPLVFFLGLAALFLFRLGAGDPSKLPSALIGRTPNHENRSHRPATSSARCCLSRRPKGCWPVCPPLCQGEVRQVLPLDY